MARMKQAGIGTVFHYVPLHNSPAGRLHGRASGELDHTISISEWLVRLPLWIGVEHHMDKILEAADTSLPAG